MQIFAVGLLAACTLLLQLPELPSIAWIATLLVTTFLAFFVAKKFPKIKSPCFLIMGLCLGFSWALYSAHDRLSDRLPQSLEGVDLIVTGNVAGIPQRSDSFSRFEFAVKSVSRIDYADPAVAHNLPARSSRPTVPQFQDNGRFRLNWHKNAPQLNSGDLWQLRVRLKRPNGLMNPGGFDYEGWLFRHGIDAVGYVRSVNNNALEDGSAANQRLGANGNFNLDRLRQVLVTKMTENLRAANSGGLIRALVIGDRSGITASQWQTMRDTGTSHLMAISGLHIGLVAGMVFFLMRWLWIATPSLFPAQKAAAIAAILAALIYAGLAGFSIPTQRAFIMVFVAMLSLLLQRQFQAGQYLSAALIGVIFIDPFAPMDAGFWLSFAAVAVLLLGMSRRLGQSSLWWRWGRAQWVVFIGLLPLIVFYFTALPLSAPIANILAIPWVTFLTVPLSLIGAILIGLPGSIGIYGLQGAAQTLDIFWPILQWIQSVVPVYTATTGSGLWAVVAAVIGSLLLLLPRGIPARWLGLLWLFPLMWPQAEKLPLGALKFTLLDVGQGLSVVVETTNHVLIYDTGAKFSQRFDSAGAAILPFLRYNNLQQVDALVLSHNDNDHVGSAESLLAGVRVEQILSSYAVAGLAADRKACYRGQFWTWDKIEFEVLHPPSALYAGMNQDNNQSCVIRISVAGRAILLTGDIEAVIEKQLLQLDTQANKLRADILLVPHHGSASSSTQAFIDQVDPDVALASTGYRNRWGFPKSDVVERYLQRGIEFYTTAQFGAMTFAIDGRSSVAEALYRNMGQDVVIQLERAERIDQKRFWYSR